MAAYPKDPARSFSANGRPMKKPRRIVPPSQSSVITDNYTLERPRVISWKHLSPRQRLESRPPLTVDLEVPTPCTYVVQTPKSDTVSSNHMGSRWPKYPRDLLPYSNTQPWTFNVNVRGKVPTMCSYTTPNVLGKHCPTKRDAPAFTMATKGHHQQQPVEFPGPNRYHLETAVGVVTRQLPSFSIGLKRDRQHSANSPGPAHYHPNNTFLYPHNPAYTMRSRTI